MTYDERIAQLFSLHRSVQTGGFSPDAYKPGLDAMIRFDAVLGHPHLSYPTVHVAGTNGKGSVCSMIAAALASTGLRVGLYTSPHLLDFRERMKIVGKDGWTMIPRQDVLDFLDRYESDAAGLTFFEITTGMAFSWFASQKVDAAVIETGLGGRLDSTNIITPRLSVITSIGLDHCDLLGSTRAEIAAEKAGIFKPGVPALVWGRDSGTQPVFEDVASRKGSPLHYADDLASLPETLPQEAHAAVNYRTAAAALQLLGIQASSEPLLHAASLTGLRARWEILREDPLTICDIGHNPPAISYNVSRLQALRQTGNGSLRPLIVVYGAMADKDVSSISGLLPTDATYILAAPATPRAMDVGTLALKLKHLRCRKSRSVADAVRKAFRLAAGLPDPIVYIGGSTYVASEAISYIESV